ncbi:hypothetical protein [Carbonactinospora thermoautotrophica]|nr:hypothetical protein [Carbonactinospora thermoautotrophica]
MMRTTRAVFPALLLLAAACGGQQDTHAHDHAGHDHGHMAHYTGNGLTEVVHGYRLGEVSGPPTAGKTGRLSFRVYAPSGRAQTEFEIEQTKKMHVYVVRKDLTDFDHVHPEMAADGTWSTPLTLERPGPYRVVAEFLAKDDQGVTHHLVLGTDIEVPGAYQAATLPPPTSSTAVDGYEVSVDGQPVAGRISPLTLRFSRDGRPVTDLQPFLGAYAHLTGFHEGDLAVTHLHPEQQAAGDKPGGPKLDVAAQFLFPGRYRIYIQFQAGQTVHTAPITLQVR